jgi:hypothetical protein
MFTLAEIITSSTVGGFAEETRAKPCGPAARMPGIIASEGGLDSVNDIFCQIWPRVQYDF